MFGTGSNTYPVTFEYAGHAESADGTAEVLDVKGDGGFAAKLFVDANTHLPLMLSWMDKEPLAMQVAGTGRSGSGSASSSASGGQVIQFNTAGGAQPSPEEMDRMQKDMADRMKEAEAKRRTVEFRMFYGDYRAVDGVKLPMHIQRMVEGAHGRTDVRQGQGQSEDRSEEVHRQQVTLAMRKLLIAFCVLPILINPKPAKAQDASAGGRLAVTVTDQTGGVIPSATVTAISTAAAGARPIAPVLTGADGVAVFEKLEPGRYTLRAEFSGFETVEVRDYRLRAGENKRSITLPIRKVAEDVTVARDKQGASLDPRGSAFSTVLTREQIAMLPDDPDEMEAVLRAMAPPGATIRVDGFTGGRLPPKSQIRSIRLPRIDQYAAQNHGGMNGLMFIDIMTQPGNGPLRGSLDVTVRDDALNAKNPFAQAKGLESLRQGGFSLSGTIAPNRSSFSLHRAAPACSTRHRCWWPFLERRAQVSSGHPPIG